MIREENMDKIFRQKLEGLSEEPPEYIWDGIQEELALRNKKRRLMWYGWSAVAALLAIAFITGRYFSDESETPVPQVAKTEAVKQSGTPVLDEQPVSSSDDEKTEEISQFATVVNFPEPSVKRPVASYSSGDGLAAREKMKYMKPATVDMNIKDRIECFQVRPPGLAALASLQEKKEEKIIRGLFDREQEIVQNNAKEFFRAGNNRGKWKMGLNIAPGYSSYRARHGATYASNMTYKASDGNGNLGGGLSVQYKTGGRWSLESGIFYARNGQQTSSSPQLFGGRMESDYSTGISADKLYFNTIVTMTDNNMTMNSTAGIIEFETLPDGAEIAAIMETTGMYSNSLMIRGELSQVFDFVEIPLYMRYLLVNSIIDVELIGGINAGLIAGNNAFVDNEFGVQNIGKTSDISAVNVSGTLGFGVTYDFGRHFSLAVEPRMNYYLNSISRNPDVEFRPFRVGVYTGLYYAF